MTSDDIKQRIRLGEDSSLELKMISVTGGRVSKPDAHDISDEFGAAANASGCTFLFGVDDKTREVNGVPLDKLDIVETWVRDICNDSVKPPVPATINKIVLKDSFGIERYILRVDVPKSLFVHKGAHGYFYRIGSSKREMTPDMLARLFQQRSQTRLVCFDEQVVATASIDVLKPELFRRFRTKFSPRENQEFLRKLHLIAQDERGVVCPTVAGILFACEHPEVYLPSAYIQAVCYRGTNRDADDQIDAHDIVGPLDQQINDAYRFVKKNMRIAAIKDPSRIDVPQFALKAVFEAVVNAVAHRDYSISGAKIRLHMFADRLELFSPGGLPNALTIDEIGERQFARNELVCTCLSRCPLTEELTNIDRTRLMDRRGEGVPIILDSSFKLSNLIPKYTVLSDSEVLLTLYSAPVDNPVLIRRVAKGLQNIDKQLTEDTPLARIIELMRNNPQITQNELVRELGLSRTSIANWIKKSNGSIIRVGSRNSGYWKVSVI